jgi:hypothetical protein
MVLLARHKAYFASKAHPKSAHAPYWPVATFPHQMHHFWCLEKRNRLQIKLEKSSLLKGASYFMNPACWAEYRNHSIWQGGLLALAPKARLGRRLFPLNKNAFYTWNIYTMELITSHGKSKKISMISYIFLLSHS